MSRLRPKSSRDGSQLGFGFAPGDAPDAFAPEDPGADAASLADAEDAEIRAAERLYDRLVRLGLQHVRRVVLTRNRSILVSVKGFDQHVATVVLLRVHPHREKSVSYLRRGLHAGRCQGRGVRWADRHPSLLVPQRHQRGICGGVS